MKNEMKNEKKQETVTITTYQWCDIQDQYVVVKVEKAVKNKSIDWYGKGNTMNYRRKEFLRKQLKRKQDAMLTPEERRERNYYDSYGVNGADVGYRADTIRAVCAATDSIYLK